MQIKDSNHTILVGKSEIEGSINYEILAYTARAI